MYKCDLPQHGGQIHSSNVWLHSRLLLRVFTLVVSTVPLCTNHSGRHVGKRTNVQINAMIVIEILERFVHYVYYAWMARNRQR